MGVRPQCSLIVNWTELSPGERVALSFVKAAYEEKAAPKLSRITSKTIVVTIQVDMFAPAHSKVARGKSPKIVTMNPDFYTRRSYSV